MEVVVSAVVQAANTGTSCLAALQRRRGELVASAKPLKEMVLATCPESPRRGCSVL